MLKQRSHILSDVVLVLLKVKHTGTEGDKVPKMTVKHDSMDVCYQKHGTMLMLQIQTRK